MKSQSLYFPFLAILIVTFGNLFGITLEELEVAYKAKLLKLDQKRLESHLKLTNGYTKALQKARTSYQKAGKLEKVEFADQEIALVAKKTWPLPQLPKEIEREVGPLRKAFRKRYLEIEKNWASDLTTTSESMLEHLDKQTVSLTKENNLKAARAAKALKEKIQQDEAIAEAVELNRNVRTDGSSRPAFRLRRWGDNIEVIVMYDLQGKISMDSPVENVKELTNSDGEKGNTTAKTLGEFVGAPGYEVDPLVRLEAKLSDGKLDELNFVDFKHKARVKVADEPALRLTAINKAANTHFFLRNALPPLKWKGTFRITCDYLVPEENKLLGGVSFIQNLKNAIKYEFPKKRGVWTAIDIESPSLNESTLLRVYGARSGKQAKKEMVGEEIYLKNFKLSVISFTSFIHTRYGEEQEVVDDSEKQPIFTLNGEIVKN